MSAAPPPWREDPHTSARKITGAESCGAQPCGPYRAPDIRLGDRQPTTDGGRVMCGPERAVDYNSSPVMCGSLGSRG
jgi:hypothetical protein